MSDYPVETCRGVIIDELRAELAEVKEESLNAAKELERQRKEKYNAMVRNKELKSDLAACQVERDALSNDFALQSGRFKAAVAEIELLRGTIFELQAMVGERADLLMTDADFYEAVKEILKQ